MSGDIELVLFDVGGVIIPQPQVKIANYSQELGLPRSFLGEVFVLGESFKKLEKGELTLNEFLPQFDTEVKEHALKKGLKLSDQFSAKELFNRISSIKKTTAEFEEIANQDMLRAATILRSNGIKTCVLTNNWIVDDKDKIFPAKFISGLRNYFSEVIQSAESGLRKPDPKIYKMACRRMGVSPYRTAFLDDIGANLKSAKSLGITCIKVADPLRAVIELGNLTGLNLLDKVRYDPLFPAPCQPDSVAHGYINVREDVKIHYVELGSGPVVMLLHGFPDFWYGWRHQIPALANAGYRVIALDQRGYGNSSAPYGIHEYCQEELCRDVVTVMDNLGIPVATVIGHDWGGQLAWNLALHYPHRFNGVCGVNTPFFGVNLKRSPMVSLRENPGVFDYQLYFQEPGVAEAELERDMKRTFKTFLRGASDLKIVGALQSSSNVRKRGGFMVGFPKDVKLSGMLSERDLEYYVENFKKNGFRGPLNWYRNMTPDWRWRVKVAHRRITVPGLMVTAENDGVLKPEFTIGMEKRVTQLDRLHIGSCSHWTMQDQPYKLNRGLISWLNKIVTVSARL